MGLRNYTVVDQAYTAPATPPHTILNITGGTTLQVEVYQVIVSSGDTPANVSQTYLLGQTTTTGTGAATPPTGKPTNPACMPPSLATVSWHHPTTEPAYITSGTPTQGQGEIYSVNKQNTWRWVVQPGYGLGQHSALAASNGVGLKLTAASTIYPCDTTIAWAE